MANQVTLTFAGDATKLNRTFDQVGQSARQMGSEVGSASRSVGEGFDRAGEAADDVDTKAMGFRDTLTGVQDTMGGVSAISKGDLFNGFFQLGAGIGDLGSGFANFLIPAMKNFSKTAIASTVNTVRQTAATIASRTAQIAVAGATKAWAVAQRALNLVLAANPVGLVITAIALLVVGLIAAYKKSETFRNIVNGAFGAVKNVALSVVNFFTGTLWPGMKRAWAGISSGATTAKNGIVSAFNSVVGFVRQIPGKIGGFFRNIGSVITSPFWTAFNGIRNAWNNTIGGKGFSFPGIAGHGAFSFRVPYFHSGGIVPGGLGSESLAVLRAGERVTSTAGGGGAPTLVIRSDGSRLASLLIEVLKESIRVRGGNVQVVLGT